MKTRETLSIALAMAMAPMLAAEQPALSGDYLEVRTCNVYAGSCFANGEMGLTGKEAILAWSIDEGSWKGARLDGLNVIAVVVTDETLGDLKIKTPPGEASIIIDARATEPQKAALTDMVRALSGPLISKVVTVKTAEVEFALEETPRFRSVTVKAGKLVEISTLDMSAGKGTCGNEEVYYPPLTEVGNAKIGYTDLAIYTGSDLGRKWEVSQFFGSYVGTFSLLNGMIPSELKLKDL